MESLSVSKGCFVYKNGATRADKSTKKTTKRKQSLSSSGLHARHGGLLGKEMTEQPFYMVYSDIWSRLRTDIEQLQSENYARTLQELIEYITSEGADTNIGNTYGLEDILPTAALLTGINQPDHLKQFLTLAQRLQAETSASVCMLQSRECATLKAAVESMVYNFLTTADRDDANNDNDDDEHTTRLRRSDCNMKRLKRWYVKNFAKHGDGNKQRHLLVVILPDFECFTASVLQDFILVLSSYCTQLSIVLVLGVATALTAVHNALAYHVTSKMKLRVFQTQPAPVVLNEILEKVILSPKYAFHLSGKAFKFLTHIFLYYDFSINGFIQGYKYCMMEHFLQGNAYSLCSNYAASLTRIQSLTHDDMETIRRLLSFRPYVERVNDCKRIIAILTDDDYLKRKLPQLLRDCHLHFMQFRTFLELLTVLVSDLPRCPLGKQRRELYTFCLSKSLTIQPEFKECWQVLSLMCKDEFVAKISAAIKTTETFVNAEIRDVELGDDCADMIAKKLQTLKDLLTKVVMAGADVAAREQQLSSEQQLQHLHSRQDLKERLLQLSKQQKRPITAYASAVEALLSYVQREIVDVHLLPLDQAPPLHELFVFTDIATVRRNLIGAPRAALHVALNNPHFYLQCKCCPLPEQSQLLATLPDLSIVYKLHLECGRMINLYDWLQAFRAVVDCDALDANDEQEQIDPQIQARFTRAVAELQFLGYIKMSKRKTDHATRLTW